MKKTKTVQQTQNSETNAVRTDATGNDSAGTERHIEIDLIEPHPGNPRKFLNEEWIEEKTEEMRNAGKCHPAYPLLVRPQGDRFQIVNGHHRFEAAKRAGLSELPCKVLSMGDEEAFKEMIRANAHNPLSKLEIGIHVFENVKPSQGKKSEGLQAYASALGMKRARLSEYRKAAEVYLECSKDMGDGEQTALFNKCAERVSQLIEIGMADKKLWGGFVRECIDRDLTVKECNETRQALGRLNHSIPESLGVDPGVVFGNLEFDADRIEDRQKTLVELGGMVERLGEDLAEEFRGEIAGLDEFPGKEKMEEIREKYCGGIEPETAEEEPAGGGDAAMALMSDARDSIMRRLEDFADSTSGGGAGLPDFAKMLGEIMELCAQFLEQIETGSAVPVQDSGGNAYTTQSIH